jgi:hypothetical protein
MIYRFASKETFFAILHFRVRGNISIVKADPTYRIWYLLIVYVQNTKDHL